MSDALAPPWMDGWNASSPPDKDEARPVGNPGWYAGMKSPNPAGRPCGATVKTKLMEKMLAEADGVVEAILTKARDGDVGAASLIISRVLPALKAQSERVQFEFEAAAPAARQVEQVLQAVSEGAVSVDVGKQFCEAIGTLSQIRATEELDARISALEEARCV
jgi:hypothetical protein